MPLDLGRAVRVRLTNTVVQQPAPVTVPIHEVPSCSSRGSSEYGHFPTDTPLPTVPPTPFQNLKESESTGPDTSSTEDYFTTMDNNDRFVVPLDMSDFEDYTAADGSFREPASAVDSRAAVATPAPSGHCSSTDEPTSDEDTPTSAWRETESRGLANYCREVLRGDRDGATPVPNSSQLNLDRQNAAPEASTASQTQIAVVTMELAGVNDKMEDMKRNQPRDCVKDLCLAY
ncbi:hypothetical protein FBU59_001728 [Linderina macrospora]|uniref:Uncharacterized protein n=1 Tax=Linderina macrospora TaxID=4868 RepID=A0ACC1JD58_9FUNG|nr:hypothetical protein FBU59_001728 [Linderina macrospora]